VTFSVDPEYDTSPRLIEYAKKYRADLATWHFLTASSAREMERVVVDGFRTAMGEKKQLQAGMFDIAHTTKLALVDWEGNIRGYYSTDTSGLDEIFHRSQHVLKQMKKVLDEAEDS
jgi:protein SCO1/2